MAKISKKFKLIIAFITISISLSILLLLINDKSNPFSFLQSNTTLNQTSNPTSFISHPQIIETQKSLEEIQINLNRLEIDNLPLLPPNLDMNVNL